MMEEYVVEIQNVSKKYSVYPKSIDRMKELLHPLRRSYHHDFYALQNISLKIRKGSSVGIIGKNGSGKSTLLKIISGITTPSSGTVHVKGKVSALLELGAGFNPELTGYENIFFQGAIMGISRKEMEKSVKDILDFADIGEHIHQPVKTYSSGMFVRLAFSLATCIQPDILIVDEALAVGDMFFQSKCMMRMKRLIQDHTTMIYVSHDINSLKSVCEEAILLEEGKLIASGSVADVAEMYFHSLFTQKAPTPVISSESQNFEKNKEFMRIKNGPAEVSGVSMLKENKNLCETFDFNDQVTFHLEVEAKKSFQNMTFAIHIRDQYGVDVVYFDDSTSGVSLPNLNTGQKAKIMLSTKLPLSEGDYVISVILSKVNELGAIDISDFIPLAYHFKMSKRQPRPIFAKVSLPTETTLLILENEEGKVLRLM